MLEAGKKGSEDRVRRWARRRYNEFSSQERRRFISLRSTRLEFSVRMPLQTGMLLGVEWHRRIMQYILHFDMGTNVARGVSR